MTVDLGIFDPRSRAISLYFLDWDRQGREQWVEVIDSQARIVESYLVKDFQNGRYLTINLQGYARIRITRKEGGNAVLNGIFFDAAPEEISSPKPLVIGSSRLANGYFEFQVTGRAGSHYCLDRSHDLAQWTCVATNLLRTEISSFFDAANPQRPSFFRGHYVP
jgi:hypothetical protein